MATHANTRAPLRSEASPRTLKRVDLVREGCVTDADLFDRMSRLVGTELNRRGVGRGLAALGVLWGVGHLIDLDEVSAKNKNKKKRKKRRRRRKKAQAGPATKADAACTAAGNGSSANGNARYAQTFTALTSGPLVRAEMRIGKAEGTVGDYILRLSAVHASGVPTNTVLATALVPNNAVPVGVGMVSFTFPTPYSVVAGVRYALVVTRPGATSLQVSGKHTDTCAGGAFFSNDQDDPFAESVLADISFATYLSS
jgi:hypothetical protein